MQGLSAHSWNFSIRFWRQYMLLFASIAAIVFLLLTSHRISSLCMSFQKQQEHFYSFLGTIYVIILPQ